MIRELSNLYVVDNKMHYIVDPQDGQGGSLKPPQ